MRRIEHLSGGLSNSTYKILLEHGDRPLVLRVYERDAAVCRKELALLDWLNGIVPVPHVVHAEPDGLDGSAPFVILEYVEGITFRQMKAQRDRRALAQASYSIGLTLAAISAVQTHEVLRPRDASMFQRLSASLASPHLVKRTGEDLARRIPELALQWTRRLDAVSKARQLVHGDFLKRNILVRERHGRWEVAAVLDWECAFAGSPLVDVATFLRYEHAGVPVAEPHFSRGFVDGGGELPDDWKALVRVVDLDSLCRILVSPTLPDDVAVEVRALIEATVVRSAGL